MPRIPDDFIKTVFYIFPSEDAARYGEELGGTGFFINIRHTSEDTGKNYQFIYAITNAHVIFKNDHQEFVYLRVNLHSGGLNIIRTRRRDWDRHPLGCDLACFGFSPEDGQDFLTIPNEFIVDKEFIQSMNVGPGDEVFMIGRFRGYQGNLKNLPSPRFGNISNMIEEPLLNQYSGLSEESFIVEMRSISGYSGSPVFLFIPPFSYRYISDPKKVDLKLQIRLLGVDWGHITYTEKMEDEAKNIFYIKRDSAFAGVVPAWKIDEIIDSDGYIRKRISIIKGIEKQNNS